MKLLRRLGTPLALLLSLSLGTLSCAATETPDYELVEKQNRFEIRRYDKLPVAMTGMQRVGDNNQSFRKLFKYISGENEKQSKIAMTSPVIMDEGKDGRMRFIVPREVAEKGAPEASNPDVEIGAMDGGRYAVLTFGNGRKKENREEAAKKLSKLLEKRGLETRGPVYFSFYDPPFKPAFLCTFEVWQRLEGE